MNAEELREIIGERVMDSTVEASRLFGSQMGSGEFWVLLFDSCGAEVIKEAVSRYYPPDKTQDCFVFLSECAKGREFFGVASLRRRAMLARQLRYLLLRVGVAMSEREILQSRVLVVVERDRQKLLGDFCREFFGDSFVIVGASDSDAQKLFEGERK
jgi:hypothetical protein